MSLVSFVLTQLLHLDQPDLILVSTLFDLAVPGTTIAGGLKILVLLNGVVVDGGSLLVAQKYAGLNAEHGGAAVVETALSSQVRSTISIFKTSISNSEFALEILEKYFYITQVGGFCFNLNWVIKND